MTVAPPDPGRVIVAIAHDRRRRPERSAREAIGHVSRHRHAARRPPPRSTDMQKHAEAVAATCTGLTSEMTEDRTRRPCGRCAGNMSTFGCRTGRALGHPTGAPLDRQPHDDQRSSRRRHRHRAGHLPGAARRHGSSLAGIVLDRASVVTIEPDDARCIRCGRPDSTSGDMLAADAVVSHVYAEAAT